MVKEVGAAGGGVQGKSLGKRMNTQGKTLGKQLPAGMGTEAEEHDGQMDIDEEDEGENEDEEDDDEDEYDEDDDENDNRLQLHQHEVGSKRARTQEDGKQGKKRRRDVNPFIDDTAEVQEGEEEDEEDEGGDDEELLDDEQHASATELQQAKKDAAARAEVHRKQRQQTDEEINPEELERYYRNMDRQFDPSSEGALGEALTNAEQKSLQPSASDPKLFAVRVKAGKEREVVVCVLQKAAMKRKEGKPLPIYSIVSQDYLGGMVYVEAYKENHVKMALENIRNVYQKKVTLVPLQEMESAVSVEKRTSGGLKPGGWARVKSGRYAGDLARVLSLRSTSAQAVVQLVPRLDYEELAGYMDESNRGTNDGDVLNQNGENLSRKKRNNRSTKRARPPQKLFQRSEAQGHNLFVREVADKQGILKDTELHGHKLELCCKMFFADGYLIKTLSTRFLKPDEEPALDEINSWIAGGRTDTARREDLQKAVELAPASEESADRAANKFAAGDPVYLIDTDLTNSEAKVKGVTPAGFITIGDIRDPTDGSRLKDESIDMRPSQLRKNFKSGDHVRVCVGQHTGETGMVSHVDGGICTIFTDVSREEIQVFLRDVTSATEVSGATQTLGGYSVNDLVDLESTVGVITHVNKDTLEVITPGGTVERPNARQLRLPDIRRKINDRRATAVDIRWREIKLNDMVEIATGPAAGQSGSVLHIHRGNLFVRISGLQRHGGLRCVKSEQCRVYGSSSTNESISGTTSQNATGINGGGQMAPLGAPMSPGQFPTSTISIRNRTNVPKNQKDLVDKMVRIDSGVYKHYRGRVKDTTDLTARIELEANSKTVTEKKENIKEEGEEAKYGSTRAAPPGGMTPSRTPAHGGITPAHGGGITPAHGGGITPAHGGITPAYGGITPAHGGGTTPAHQSAMTPAHGAMTPAPTGGAMTPSRQAPSAPQSPAPHAQPNAQQTQSTSLAAQRSNQPPPPPPSSRTVTAQVPTRKQQPQPPPPARGQQEARASNEAGTDGNQEDGVVPSKVTAFTAQKQKLSPGLVVQLPDDRVAVVHEVGTGGDATVTVSDAEVGDDGKVKRATGTNKTTVQAHEVSLYKGNIDSNDKVRAVAGQYLDREGNIIGIDGDSTVIHFGDAYEVVAYNEFALIVPLK